MIRTLAALAVPAAAAAAVIAGGIVMAQPPRPAAVLALVAEGEKIFQATCSNQLCHGPGGAGAKGPKLVDFPMTQDHVSTIIREGRAGTQMAGFKAIMKPADLDAVTAYVMSISSGGMLPTSVPPPRGTQPPPPPGMSTVPVAIGNEKGIPAAGAELFFDATNLASCRTCHSYNRRGGPLGIDFTLARKTPEDILAALAKPNIAARAYPVVRIALTDGTKLTGIRGTETAEVIRVFDLAVPPVRRTFLKSDIAAIENVPQGLYDHSKLVYTRQEKLDIAAFLGSPVRP